MKMLDLVLTILAVVFGVLSTICSAVVIRFTPVVTTVIVVLELLSITSYGIWTVVGYGLLTILVALLIFGCNALLLAMIGAKIK